MAADSAFCMENNWSSSGTILVKFGCGTTFIEKEVKRQSHEMTDGDSFGHLLSTFS